MSNTKCLNLSHPIVKQNIKDISIRLGLQNETISLNEYKAVVRAFSIQKDIENNEVFDYIGSQEYDDFLNDYFNIGKSIEFSSDLEDRIIEFLEENREYINIPLEDTTENRMIANGIYIATEEKAQIINLANNKFIIKVNSVNETNSLEDINIYKHLLHKDIISEEDYIEFITEFELNRDKTDSFLYNFVTKILQVNPKNKRDNSISLTVQNYPTSDKIFSNFRTRDILIENILGLHSPVGFDSETFEQELKEYIENRWEKDLYDELVRLDKEKLARLNSLYKEKATLKRNISLLQSYLKSKDNSSKEVLEYIESFKWNKKETTSISQHIAYELKKKKEELASLEEKIKHFRFSNAAKTLKVKNRLAALYNIENAKELIFNRIKADRDSYKLPKEEWEEKIAPYIPLYEKAVKASKGAKMLDYNNPIFENKKSLDEVTVDEIYDNLIKFNSELKPLLDFIRTINPKLKIKVYNTEDYENLAERKDDYISGASASIYFPRKNEIGFRLNADTPTVLHELLHSVSSYGLIGSSKDQKALGENVIQPFIDYIDNYLRQHVGNFGAATIWGVKMPAHIYGLTNPAEFIAELFSNKDFQELLDSIPPMEKKQYNSLLEEIIDSILEFVKSIFSPKTNDTALDQAKQLALAVIRTQQEHMEEIYEQLANMEDTVQKQILGKGELISSSAKASKKTVVLSKTGYKKGDPQKNPNVDYVFTENAEAYAYTTGIKLGSKIKFPNPNAPKINVSDVKGTNQAGIRTDNKGNITSNAYGIVVKKYQQDSNGKFVAKEGQFKDTKEDFDLFVSLNEHMFKRLEESNNSEIVFPTQMALGKAALPKKFAEWLQKQLQSKFGIESSIEENTTSGYEGYGLKLQNIISNLPKTNSKTKTTLEDRVAEIESVYKSFKKVVFQDEDFKTSHDYIIIEDGAEYYVDFSATSLNSYLQENNDKSITLKELAEETEARREALQNNKEYNEKIVPPNGGVYPQKFIGNGFDALVRKYYNGGVTDLDFFDNISDDVKKSVIKQLKQLDKHFDAEFGKGKYKVITGFGNDEFVVGGYITDSTGAQYATAGTLDMIVVTDNGDIYIYDMKTDSHEKGISKKNIQKYQGQLTLYKKLIAKNFPELADRIKGIRIISADVRFGDLTAEDIQQGASVEFEDNNGTLLHNGIPVEDKEGFINIKINVTKGDNYSLVDLQQSYIIEQLEIDPLTFDEEQILEETLTNSKEDPITELERLSTENNDDKKFDGTSTYKDFEIDNDVDFTEETSFKTLIKPTERIYLGRQIMKTMSDFLNELNTDDSARLLLTDIAEEPIYEEENYFVNMDRDKMLTSKLMSEIFDYIKEEYFNYDDMEVDDPEFEKTRWIHNNFMAIVNGAFAELVELEGVSLVGGDVVHINQNDDPVTKDDISYREENAKQAYDVSNRNTSVIASMNQTVKRELSLIHDYQYNTDGSLVTIEENGEYFPLYNEDKGFDIPKYLDKDVVITTIQKLVYNKRKVSEMIKSLKSEVLNYPWLEQVISKLEANDNNYQSKFFNTFYKSRTNYIKVYKEEDGFGKNKKVTYIHADLRDSAKRDAILDNLNKKLFAETEEELPLIFIKEEGNNAPGLVSIDIDELEDFKEALKDLQGKRREARETQEQKEIRRRRGLSDIFDILGIEEDVSIYDILDKKNSNRLNILIENFKSLEKAFIARSNKREAVIADDITNPYYGIAETLSYFIKDHVEISYYDNGDNWMVFTQPTYIQTLVERLQGAEMYDGISYEESLGKLMQYNQFVSVGEDGSRVFVSEWLKELIENPESRDIINHFVRTSIDNKKHFKQSSAEYLLGMLVNYAAPTATNSKYDVPRDVAMYRMPIMSDKPAGDMILFRKYGDVDLNNPTNNYNLDYMKEQIADMAFNFFKLEVTRMRAIREQLTKNTNSDVEFYHIPRKKGETSKWIAKNEKGENVPIQFDITKFLETRGLKRFNGFKFHYCPMFNAEMDNNTKVAQLVLDIINSSDETVIAEKFDVLQDMFNDIFIAGKEAEYREFIETRASKLNKNALFNSIPQIGSEEQYDAFMQDFFWNDSFAAMNIYNLTIIDPAFYKDTIDLQKRYAQMHASTSKVNVEAEFEIDGKMQRVSDGNSRVIYISDLEAVSELSKSIPSLFEKLAKEEKDPTRKLELQILAKDLASKYKSIDVTDGQSYGTLTSFWKKLYMLGEDTPELNKAILDLRGSLEKIENGEFSLDNYDLCLQAFKPFVYTQIEHPNDTKALGKYLCPTQIKNSEALIHLGMSILKGMKTKGFTDSSHILAGIMEVVEGSHWTKDGQYKNDGIDTIAFHSAVKNGDYAEINLNDCTSKEQVVARLKQAIYQSDDDSINDYNDKFVKKYPFLEWGKQQEVPGHMQDHEQGEGSQNRIIVVADLPEDFELKVGNKTYKSDKKSSARAKLLKRYFDLIAEEMQEGVASVREELQIDSDNITDKYKAISKLLINSIVKDAKYTDEMRKAFSLLENGDFVGAVGDPSISDKLFSAIFSLIKKNVNDQKFPGGPVVVTSVYGSEDLGIKYDNPKTKEGMYYEIMITCPTEDLERRITVNTKKIKSLMKKAGVKTLSRQYVDGELFDVVDALALGLITEEETWVECQRIPTEDKYSIFRCKVIKFLPRQIGERFVGPKEITKISGMDMDIDKVFTKFKYNLKSLEKKEKEGTLKPKEAQLLRTRRRRNEIFDIQYAALGHPMSYANTLNTGNFEPLKELADKVDTSRGAEHSLMNINGQIYFFEQNGGGKEYVGIAALNNIAHHICNMAELSFTDFPYFTINGRESFKREKDELTTTNYRFDNTYSIFDDSRISRTIGMFVGAAADNAKEAVLASINIIPTTATLAKGMLRMGIPLDTVVYMLNHPAVKEATRIALESNKPSDFNAALAKALKEAQKEADYTDSIEDLVANTDFLNDDLYSRVHSSEILNKDKLFDIRVLGFLNMMMPYCQAIADVSIITSLNSTKNAVGPKAFDTLKRMLKIQRVINDVREGNSLISDSLLNIYDKIPYLKVLESCFSELMPEICGDLSPIYAKDFLNLISVLEANGLDIVYMEDKDFTKLINSWLLYKASGNKGILDSSFENRKKMIYDFPLRFIQAQRNGSLDNEFIKSLNTPTTMNKRNPIINITFNSIGKSRAVRSDLAASWEELASSDNAARKELSNDLMTYMMFRFGWSFSPKSAMNIAPNKAKENYTRYKDIFSTNDNYSETEMMNFLYQYARNNWYSKMWVNPHLDSDEGMFKTINGKTYYILKDPEVISHLNFLKIGKSRYIRVNASSFVKVTQLGVENNFLEFDGSSSNGMFMSSVIDRETTNKQKKSYTGLQVEDNTFEDNDEQNEDDNSNVTLNTFISEKAIMPEYISNKEFKSLLDNKKVLNAIEEKGFKTTFNKEVKSGNVEVVYEMLEKIANAATTVLTEKEIQKSYKNIIEKFKEDSLC